MKLNLLFNLYPIRGSIWPWHIDQLVKYRNVWNGQRIVLVSLDTTTASVDEVKAKLAPLNAEIIFKANDPAVGETAHFIDGMALLESKDEDEATFYAHAKGVTHKKDAVVPIQAWSEMMYTLNLGHLDAVQQMFTHASAIGAFRQKGAHCGSEWHFSGTYFWLKHSAIFSKNWRDIVPDRYGVEAYPGRHIRFEESCGLTPDVVTPLQLYRGEVTPDMFKVMESWLDRREADDRGPIYGFMHIACLNHWHEIVQSQIWKIKESGLLAATKKIYWGILGEPDTLFFDPVFMSKVQIGFTDSNLKLFEFPTLAMLDDLCRRENCTVWYIHTKGASYQDKREEAFREHLEQCSVNDWKTSSRAIRNGHDAAGAIWRPNECYLGNFWWASSRHIRDIMPIRELDWSRREGAEVWISRLTRKRPYRMASLAPFPG